MTVAEFRSKRDKANDREAIRSSRAAVRRPRPASAPSDSGI